MPILTDAVKNAALDQAATLMGYLAVHSAYSASGANESSTARQAIAWDAASGAVVAMTGTESLAMPDGSTGAWLGLWTAVTGGVFRGMLPNSGGEAPRQFAAATTDTLTSPGHGYSNGQRVTVLPGVGGAVPAGLTVGAHYWVINAATDTLQLSATQGGSAVDITAAGSGLVQRIRVETFDAAGTINVNAMTLTLAG
ncbi:hypothetical protein [Parafrankia discariae]|uniref:hypothetical protein n=1 Tax=Parafrankia discariae TaxID=365528 RepID=UPI00036CDF87|nr:hypothetical protein [Parafrankia discariae]